MSGNLNAEAKVLLGKESWAYIYVFLGFALAIEGTIVQMLTSIVFPYNLILYLFVGALSFWVFIYNGWFQDRLIGLKNRIENTPR